MSDFFQYLTPKKKKEQTKTRSKTKKSRVLAKNKIINVEDGSSVTSPESSPEKPPKTIILTGKIVYFCSVDVDSKIKYTKIILENQLGDTLPFKIFRIISKQSQDLLFPYFENVKKRNVMIKIDKQFLAYSVANESLNSFGETYMAPLTRTLKPKVKTSINYTLDVLNYESKRNLIAVITDPKITQTHKLQVTQGRKKD